MKFSFRLTQLFIFSLLFSGVDLTLSGKNPGDPFSYPNLFLFLFVGTGISFFFGGSRPLKITPVVWLSIIFSLLMFFGVFISIDKKAFIVYSSAILRGILFLIVVPLLIRSLKDAEKLVNSLFFLGIIGSLSAIFQEIIYLYKGIPIFGASNRTFIVNVNDVMVLRVSSFLSDPNVFAIYILVPLVILITKYESKQIKSLNFLISISLMLIALTLTFSRGALLGLMLFLFLKYLLFRKISIKGLFKFISIFLGSSILIYIVLSARSIIDLSTNLRIQLIKENFSLLAEYPILGVGVGNIHLHSSLGQTSHNLFLEIAASMGLFSLFIFLVIIYFTFRELDVVGAHSKYLSSSLKNSLLIFLLSSIFLSMITNVLLWTLIALANLAYLLREQSSNNNSIKSKRVRLLHEK